MLIRRGNAYPTLEFASKLPLVVIPNEVRNLSVFETKEQSGSSARSAPLNADRLIFFANCLGKSAAVLTTI